jgi:isopentenyl-diphosphate delta-isomerase type 1
MNSEVKPGRGEEWFDVVNDRDEVIGRELRRNVHARGLWHRAVHVLVFDRAGRVFLQKRSMLKDLSPGLWDSSCSGHVDSGEDYDTSAVRELFEEIGVRGSQTPERWFRLNACVETGWEFVWVYRLRHDGPFVLHPEEIEKGDWFTPAEVTQWMARKSADFCPSFNLLWPMAAARLERPASSG